MKIYSIIITIVAVIALAFGGYLYWHEGELRNSYSACQTERDTIAKDKAETSNKLNLAYEQLDRINRTATALNYALNSFMFAGDIKAQSIGSQEAKKVEEALSQLSNRDERIMAEGHWNDFKSTRLFNPLFGLLRGLADSINQDVSSRP
ncbi:MAG: hypothetical protein GYA31_01560 [Parcubacteria group bacterium]|nr:hypothetical protein [Parcubacteria group bacterium]